MNQLNENIYLPALISGLNRIIPDFGELTFPKLAYDNPSEIDKLITICSKLALGTDFDLSECSALETIFQYINVGEKYNGAKHYYPLLPLTIEGSGIFPKADKATDFIEYWGKFCEEFSDIPQDGNPHLFTETFIYLLRKYTSNVGLSEQLPYISLFEFLKIRAALADSIYRSDNEEQPILMLCADISGIQSFIYNILSSKAAKSMKGRSFYLQLLMDSLIHKITNHEQIMAGIGHVLYSSGGKMYMLLPNRKEVRKAIQEIEKEMIGYIFEKHKTRLYLCMSYITLAYGEASGIFKYEGETGEIGDLWRTLGEKAAEKKFRKFSSILTGNSGRSNLNFESFFEPQSEGFDTSKNDDNAYKQCQVTGELIKNKSEEKNDISDDNESGNVWVHEDVKRQIDIGYQLKKHKYFNTFQTAKVITDKHKYYLTEPLKMGVYHALKNDFNFVDEYNQIQGFPSLNNALLRRVNNTEFLPDKVISGQDSSYGFVFYGGNKQAMFKDEFGKEIREKNYHELAGINNDGENEKGFNKLGVLRLDIDGLGGVFATGMKDIQSFATHTTLSSRLDLFFAGYLNTIRKQDEFRDWVNILYSGGDDVFAVGRWDLILKFTAQIREDFRRFTGGREEVSLSAGIALVGGKFPIVKAAEMSGKAEKQAKNFERENSPNYLTTRKNALTILNETISWEDEFAFVQKLSAKLHKMLEDKQLSKGFIYKIYTFKRLKKEKKNDWWWLSAYTCSQHAKKVKGESKIFLHQIKNALATGKFTPENNGVNLNYKTTAGRMLDLIALAARIAELENR